MENVANLSCLASCENIERNIRYIIQKNSNSEIKKVKGGSNKVSIKSVIMFLVGKIEETLKI